MNNDGWIFGRKGDFIAFTCPLFLSFLCFYSFQWSIFSQSMLMTIMLFIDATHVHSTFTYTYSSSEEWKEKKIWFLAVPAILLTLNLLLSWYDMAMFWSFFATWSIYHFLKQSMAWFHVSAGLGIKRNPWTIKIDKLAIYAGTFGFTLCSLCEPNSFGWYNAYDLIQLPASLYLPLLITSLIFVGSYPVWHFYLYLKGEKQNWATHHIYLVTIFLWGHSRLMPVYPFSTYAVILSHAIPYLYLGYRYVNYNLSSGGKSFSYPSSSKIVVFVFMLTLAMLIAGTEVLSRYNPEIQSSRNFLYYFIAILFNTLSLTHYTFDMFMWNRKHNPEWVLSLGEAARQESIGLNPGFK